MEFNRDIFIFGLPIDTKFGKVRFLTYLENIEMQQQLSLISMNVLHFYYHYRKLSQNPTEEELEFLKELKASDLLTFVTFNSQVAQAYLEVFNKIVTFNEGIEMADIFNNLEDFMMMRKLVMEMNILKEEEVSPNEEIQEGIERGKLMNQVKSEKQTFEDIVTSIATGTSISFSDICDMTVYQVYAIYARLGAMINYNTTTLFATVSSDIEIEPWNKSINLLEKETKDIKRSEFERKYGEMF